VFERKVEWLEEQILNLQLRISQEPENWLKEMMQTQLDTYERDVETTKVIITYLRRCLLEQIVDFL
jgi:hypothetical protein